MPAAVEAMGAAIRAADGLIVVTPEYNFWVAEFPAVAAMYDLAKKIRVESLQDQIHDLADTGDIDRVKYQIKARQWLHNRFARSICR